MPLELSTPVKFIKRIGERVAAGLADRSIHTVEDLLYQLPFRYEDRLHPKPLSLYQPGDMASLIGEVRGTVLLRTRSGPIFEMTVGITPPSINPGAPGPASGTWVSTDASMAGLLQPQLTTHTSHLTSPLETVKCMWFHGTYLKDKFHSGQKIALYGKLEGSRSGNALNAAPGSAKFKMIQPTFEILPDAQATGESGSPASRARGGEEDAEFTMLEMGRIVPVYESLGGKTPWGAKLTSRWLRRVMWTIFRDLTESETSTTLGAPGPASGTWVSTDTSPTETPPPGAPSSPMASSSAKAGPHNAGVSATQSLPPSAKDQHETLPTSLRNRLSFPTRMEALQALHFPPAGTSMTELMSARTPAHRRLIFEEFWYLELGLELKRRRLRDRSGTAFTTNDSVREALKQVLPFKPTAAQKRVLGEIVNDMRSRQPMRRLLQGDVGSGKTIVAFQAALVAIENGYQVALMAPTEILATQHYLSARKLLSDKISPRTKRPYRIGLLTGSLDDRTKRDTRNRIFRGEIDLAIGTHALVEDKVDFANLGLVIVDEQHRFGVQQRYQLTRKPNSGTSQTSQMLSSRPESAASRGRSGETPVSRPTHPNSVIPTEATNTGVGDPFVTASSSRVGSHTANLATPPTPSGAPSSPMVSSSAKAGSQNLDPPTNPDAPGPASGTWVSTNISIGTTTNPATRSPSLDAQSSPDAQSDPDVLVMTATPIPRTLALTLYGDLEVSIIDELPPGRTPILTRRMPEERSSEVWDFVRKQVAAGRQAYIVYPIIEGSKDDQPELDFAKSDDPEDSLSFAPLKSLSSRPKSSLLLLSSRPKRSAVERPMYSSPATTKRKPQRPKLRSATEMHEELQQGPLRNLKLGLLHGRMSADDKEVTMARFKRGEIDVLVSTTVIEVGVDVPNATVMVVEHSDRFGLAQLHQLRGRVGRGAAKSYCILLTGEKISPEAELRLNAMVQTQDGFALAEIDLQQRGPGEFFGTRQAGLPEFRVANLARDRDLLELAKLEAARFVDHPDPTVPRPEIDAVWSRLKLQWQRRYGLLEA